MRFSDGFDRCLHVHTYYLAIKNKKTKKQKNKTNVLADYGGKQARRN